MDLNLSGLTEPATVLIKKISGCIGTLYEPTRIVKLALAKAKATKIETLAQIENTELQERAFTRMLNKETKKMENINHIVNEACDGLNENATPQLIEEDWISNFFDKCDMVSNVQMQSIWAKLLTTEANTPGSISKKTIELVASLDRKDAQLFTDFCSCTVKDTSGQHVPLILDIENAMYTSMGINFESLTHLDDLGLISFNSTIGYSYRSHPVYLFLYHGFFVQFTLQNPNEPLQIGLAILTRAGKELALISGANANKDFLNYLAEEYKKKNVRVDNVPIS